MKKKILTILAVSFIITIIGYAVDSDPAPNSVFLQILDFAGMFTIITLLTSFLFVAPSQILKSLKRPDSI